MLGVYVSRANHFPVGAMMEKALTIRSGQSPTQKYWRYCLEQIRNGTLDPTFIVTHRGTLEDAPELYERFFKKEEGCIKVFLRPTSEQLTE